MISFLIASDVDAVWGFFLDKQRAWFSVFFISTTDISNGAVG